MNLIIKTPNCPKKLKLTPKFNWLLMPKLKMLKLTFKRKKSRVKRI